MDVGKGEVVMQKPQGRNNQSGDTARRFTFDAVYDWTYVPLDRGMQLHVYSLHRVLVLLQPLPLFHCADLSRKSCTMRRFSPWWRLCCRAIMVRVSGEGE